MLHQREPAAGLLRPGHEADSLTDALVAGFDLKSDQAVRLRSLVRVALDFWTWERLTAEGLDDEAAVELMTEAIASLAGRPATGP
jgi:hypothetical protein